VVFIYRWSWPLAAACDRLVMTRGGLGLWQRHVTDDERCWHFFYRWFRAAACVRLVMSACGIFLPVVLVVGSGTRPVGDDACGNFCRRSWYLTATCERLVMSAFLILGVSEARLEFLRSFGVGILLVSSVKYR